MRGTVLLVDDEALIRQSTEQWLKMAHFDVISCDSAEQALKVLDEQFPGIIVTDVRMPGMDGLELMEVARQRIPELPVILVTGHGDVDMAIKAMRNGAYDFIEKPFVPERLVETINRACEKRQLMLENLRLQQSFSSQSGIDSRIIGISPSIQRLKRDLLKSADQDTNVIIYGETGSGKELVAQCLHEYSGRSEHNFVPINCGAIPDSLIESELFGHEPGAFTGAAKRRIGKFEYADNGTLFLDEIESMPANLQVKILRALQEGLIERLGGNKQIPVDLRIIAASKVDLRTEEGFREDLYYRLNVSYLRLPPLRERQEDIPLLFEHYARQAASQHERELRRVTDQDIRNMQQYSWPGNVRELKNAAVRYALDGGLSVADTLFPRESDIDSDLPVADSLSLAAQVANFERDLICRALKQHQGNIKAIMDQLDLPRRTLNQKMVKYDINRAEFLDDDTEV
ncbi:sigma-54-dependent transcriptional regulator [Amphritea balenae]|uniref:Sigma-54-dependent Fis family transcriptional regulator n=1 Tax=Amphritea balenae TaxID=452629 RepID=A0A3P1SQX9_9GAMM|nr:sigma-54 dependent transcriptional regulator [Amphritea balenae]RRC99596.1 sigma-54-dependent Fis family transcriptional regulator [Amphritea balenae]GGK78321.1 two-component system response regulator [Amphritea balenae]